MKKLETIDISNLSKVTGGGGFDIGGLMKGIMPMFTSMLGGSGGGGGGLMSMLGGGKKDDKDASASA
jgi:hypothetical protein